MSEQKESELRDLLSRAQAWIVTSKSASKPNMLLKLIDKALSEPAASEAGAVPKGARLTAHRFNPTAAPPSAPAAESAEPAVNDAMVDAYLTTQQMVVEDADRFGRPNIGGLHTNTVRSACRAGIEAALRVQSTSATADAQPSGNSGELDAQVDERAAFEAKFPMPSQTIRCGDGYASTGYSAWDSHRFIQRWEGWKARAALSRQPSAAASAPEAPHPDSGHHERYIAGWNACRAALAAPASAELSDADINELTMHTLGRWPSFEAQSWACAVVHSVMNNRREPLDPNHRPDLRYILNVLERVSKSAPKDGEVSAAVTGMRYVVSRTESAALAAAKPEQPGLQIARGEDLRKIGGRYGLVCNAGETDEDFRARIHARINRPGANAQ